MGFYEATPGGATGEKRCWSALARALEGISAQVWTLAEAGGRQDFRVSGHEQATRGVYALLQGLAQQQGIGASATGERDTSNTLVGKKLSQKGRRNRLVAGAKDDRFETL